MSVISVLNRFLQKNYHSSSAIILIIIIFIIKKSIGTIPRQQSFVNPKLFKKISKLLQLSQ